MDRKKKTNNDPKSNLRFKVLPVHPSTYKRFQKLNRQRLVARARDYSMDAFVLKLLDLWEDEE